MKKVEILKRLKSNLYVSIEIFRNTMLIFSASLAAADRLQLNTPGANKSARNRIQESGGPLTFNGVVQSNRSEISVMRARKKPGRTRPFSAIFHYVGERIRPRASVKKSDGSRVYDMVICFDDSRNAD